MPAIPLRTLRFQVLQLLIGAASCAALLMPVTSLADTTLKDSVLATVSTNPKIKVFQEHRQAAAYDIRRARAGWLPRVDASGGYGLEQFSDSYARYMDKDHELTDRSEASIYLRQTLWDGFATSSRVDISTAKFDSADYRLMDNAEALALDAILAHIDVLRLAEIVRYSENNVRQHQEILSSQMDRQRHGAASIGDVTQTQGRLARAQSSLVESRSNLEMARAAYKRLTGNEVPVDIAAPTMPGNTPPSFEAALAACLSGNPKIATYKAEVQASRGEVELDKSRFQPTVYVEVGPAYREHVDSSESYSWGTTAMVRANWNLYDGGADVAAVQASSARVRQNRQELQSLLDNLNEETRSTWARYLSAREQSVFYDKAVMYNTKSRDTYMQQFLVGQRSLLDVLDAENELYSSQIQQITAQSNEFGSAYRLLALEGNLLASIGINRSEFRSISDAATISE